MTEKASKDAKKEETPQNKEEVKEKKDVSVPAPSVLSQSHEVI
jgi:hypothetical protein